MFGPDSPAESLRAGLTALSAGRTNDARTALEAASAMLAMGHGAVAPGLSDMIAREIATALATLAAGDRTNSQRLIETALAMAEST